MLRPERRATSGRFFFRAFESTLVSPQRRRPPLGRDVEEDHLTVRADGLASWTRDFDVRGAEEAAFEVSVVLCIALVQIVSIGRVFI